MCLCLEGTGDAPDDGGIFLILHSLRCLGMISVLHNHYLRFIINTFFLPVSLPTIYPVSVCFSHQIFPLIPLSLVFLAFAFFFRALEPLFTSSAGIKADIQLPRCSSILKLYLLEAIFFM